MDVNDMVNIFVLC